ncbi:hypothetical protein NDU88_006185 [Pleurodeles waltl]|uniref:Uncharacterized protein n=1 Tax=Pleurodeles waltl TaxID=8319 RepID=A0AAV7NPI8_PLEWA|nr:hypothetical protein NDU88_006185 [Pleurodeles waltl]
MPAPWRRGAEPHKPGRCRKEKKGLPGDEEKQVRGADEENEPNGEGENTKEDEGGQRETTMTMEEKTENGGGQQGALSWTLHLEK